MNRGITIRYRTAAGFSLLELMVAMLIGTLLSAAVISTFLVSKAGYMVRDGQDQIQDNGRFAIHLMTEDMRLAGWWGINIQSHLISPGDTATTDYGCGTGWASNTAQPLMALNQDDVADHRPACIDDDNYLAGTDIIVVRHVGPPLNSENDIEAESVYLHSGLFTGTLFDADSSSTLDSVALLTEAEPLYIYPLVSHMYYVRPWSQELGDGVPTLVRSALNGDSEEEEPLVDYVENLQFSFGRDSTGDGSVDIYSDADATMSAAAWAQVRSIRVETLVRAPAIEPGYDDDASYTLGDVTIDTSGNPYRRRVFSTTVYIRNEPGNHVLVTS
jgi:type IV pilus assembly protein PilW